VGNGTALTRREQSTPATASAVPSAGGVTVDERFPNRRSIASFTRLVRADVVIGSMFRADVLVERGVYFGKYLRLPAWDAGCCLVISLSCRLLSKFSGEFAESYVISHL